MLANPYPYTVPTSFPSRSDAHLPKGHPPIVPSTLPFHPSAGPYLPADLLSDSPLPNIYSAGHSLFPA